MMVLQRGVVAICDGQGVSSLDQEIIVQASMLVVMHEGCPVGAPHQGLVHGFGLHDAPMTQQHVCHLHH